MNLYYVLTIIGLEGVFCAFTMLFATSMLVNIPLGPLETCNIYNDVDFFTECRMKYWAWIAIFLVIVVPLTWRGL